MKKRLLILLSVTLCFVFCIALLGCASGQNAASENAEGSATASSSAANESDASASEDEELGCPLDKYSWDELSAISKEIAGASDKATGINIAKKYGLCNADGTLDGSQQKSITLSDGTKTAVQIIGFSHDTKAEGGIAGITFIFKDAIANHPMNASDTNKGGWASSEMRSYLAGRVTDLPADLQQVLVAVKKKTNNTGKTDSASAVSQTDDALWLLSAVEVWGEGVDRHFGSKVDKNLGLNRAKIFDEEGTQYKLFSDLKNASDTNHRDFFEKGEKGYWWSRSPVSSDTEDFKLIKSLNDTSNGGAEASWGVVPCFCI